MISHIRTPDAAALSSPSAPPNPTQAPPAPVSDTYDAARPDTWSPLQKHAAFFDGDQNGRITVGETFDGLRAIGIGPLRSAAFALAINVGLGRTTGAPWWKPLEINIENIKAGKHGSDTGVYDADGRLDKSRFEAIFTQHDADKDGCLTRDEVASMLTANRTDKAGSVASKAEFSLLMEVAGTDRASVGDRVLTRETMERVYDGSLFYRISGTPCPFEP